MRCRKKTFVNTEGERNKLLVVTCWFGGTHLEPKRFQLITEAAAAVLTKGKLGILQQF